MFWTNKGLKQHIENLEFDISSLKEQLKEVYRSEKHITGICNLQHGLILELQARVKEFEESSLNVVVPPETPANPGKPKLSFGRNLALSLKGNRAVKNGRA